MIMWCYLQIIQVKEQDIRRDKVSEYFRVEYHQKKDRFKNYTKEERAEHLNNVICARCGYQNKMFYVRKYGTCHLCKKVLSKEHYKKAILSRLRRKDGRI